MIGRGHFGGLRYEEAVLLKSLVCGVAKSSFAPRANKNIFIYLIATYVRTTIITCIRLTKVSKYCKLMLFKLMLLKKYDKYDDMTNDDQCKMQFSE